MVVREEVGEMLYRSPLFETKLNSDDKWTMMPERDFLLNLIESFPNVTPALKKLFDGEEIVTPSIKYRIRDL